MKIRWSSQARLDLVAIHDYIAQDAPGAASNMVRRIVKCCDQLRDFPRSGRTILDFPPLRELVEPPYRIIHVLRPEDIFVVTVIHSSRVLRPEMLR